MSVNQKTEAKKVKFIAVNRVLSCWNFLSFLQLDNNVIECKIVEQTKMYKTKSRQMENNSGRTNNFGAKEYTKKEWGWMN